MRSTEITFSRKEVKSLLDVERLAHCFECGICTASCSMVELIRKDYNPRALLEGIFLSPEEILTSCEIWLCAWCYSCQRHCPQALRIPEILLSMRAIAAKHEFTKAIDDALQKIVENVPLPLVTIFTCFHPERAGVDRNNILKKMEQKYVGFLKKAKESRNVKDSGKKVAVIGSGPAGLAVAREIVLKGHEVTVFEALAEAGGMLRKCIPEQRLPKAIVAKEVQLLQSLGVEIETGVTVGKGLSFEDLWEKGYQAIFVGVGAQKSQRLKIEGEDLEGVVDALDFLWRVNIGHEIEVGKKVAVIGGGNVAVDAARTALQCGAYEVTMWYRRSHEEMPANPWEVKAAETEGVKIEFLVAPRKFLGENGRVYAIELVRMQLGEPDESGKRKPIPIEGSEFIQKTDMVILAIGEVPGVEFLPKEIELNEDGTIWVNPITMETSLQGVFAGGDAVTGPATVIEAICAGKRAATSIENYLKPLGG